MANDIKVLIKTILDDKDFKAGLKGMDTGMGKTAKKQKSLFKTMRLGWLAAAAAVALVVRGIGKLIKSASDAEETFSKFRAVFKDVSEEAEVMAKNLSKNFGLSSIKAKELLGNTGDLLTGFGFTGKAALELSNQVNELAVDLASFTNFSGGAEGASAALTKALLGERESVKSLGIAILETDVQAKMKALEMSGRFTDETNRERKAIATLAIAVEQSQNAIGDYARTQLSWANQSRVLSGKIEDLKASLGIFFKDLLIPLLPTLIKVVDKFTEWAQATDEINKSNDKTIEILRTKDDLMKKEGLKTEKQRDAVKALSRAYVFQQTSLSFLKQEMETFGLTMDEAKKKYPDAAENVRKLGMEMTKYKKILKGTVITSGKEAIDMMSKFIDKSHELAAEAEAAEEAAKKREGSPPVVVKTAEDEESLVEFYEFVGEQREADLLKEEEARVAALESLNANYDEKLRMEEEYQTKLTDLEAAHVKNVEKIDKAQAKADESLRKAEFAATKSALNDVESLMQSSSKELFAIGKAASLASATINTIEAVTKTMASVPLPLNIPLAIAQAAAGAIQVAKIASTTPGFAEGTDFAPGGQAIVGEAGPELVNLPRGAEVVPNRSLPQDIGQMITNNISNESQSIDNTQNTINVDNPTDLIASLNELEQSYGFNVLQR